MNTCGVNSIDSCKAMLIWCCVKTMFMQIK